MPRDKSDDLTSYKPRYKYQDPEPEAPLIKTGSFRPSLPWRQPRYAVHESAPLGSVIDTEWTWFVGRQDDQIYMESNTLFSRGLWLQR